MNLFPTVVEGGRETWDRRLKLGKEHHCIQSPAFTDNFSMGSSTKNIYSSPPKHHPNHPIACQYQHTNCNVSQEKIKRDRDIASF